MHKVTQYQRYTATEYYCVSYDWHGAVLVLHEVHGDIEADSVCLSAHRGEIAMTRCELDEDFLREVGEAILDRVRPNLKLAS